MEITSDGRVSIRAATLTAEQVDEFIQDLAQARSQMTPEVSKTLDINGSLYTQTDPSVFVGKSSTGGISLGLRHRGLGWCSFVLTPAAAAQIAAFIHKRTADQEVGFINDQIPDGNESKH